MKVTLWKTIEAIRIKLRVNFDCTTACSFYLKPKSTAKGQDQGDFSADTHLSAKVCPMQSASCVLCKLSQCTYQFIPLQEKSSILWWILWTVYAWQCPSPCCVSHLFWPQPQCHPDFLPFLTISLFAPLWWQRFLLSHNFTPCIILHLTKCCLILHLA